jgi:hypothetical protein
VVENLPSNHQDLEFKSPSTTKKKKKSNQKPECLARRTTLTFHR